MDGFKPINIDDFDFDFLESINTPEPAEQVEPVAAVEPEKPASEFVPSPEPDYFSSGRDSIIPEVFVEEKPSTPKPERAPIQVQAPPIVPVAPAAPAAPFAPAAPAAAAPARVNYFNRPAQDFSGSPASAPAPVATMAPAAPAAPPVMSAPQTDGFIINAGYSEEEQENEAPRSSAGRLIAKIGVIFLLAVTIVSFVLGCFVTMFLDNRKIDIAGYSMCTVDENIGDIKWLREGCLVVYKKVDIKDISAKQIAIAYKDELPYFFVVSSVVKGVDGEYTVSAAQVDNVDMAEISLGAEDVAGVAVRYIPHIAGMLTFAMNNAILVCALFILLVVFLGLIIVLIERTKIV